MTARILVVEDEWLTCQGLKQRLESEGYNVGVARDGESAMTAVRLDKPDLVLLDIGLPDCSGLDVARWLRSQMNVPIIFLTARDQEIDIVLGLELGAEDYITKPFKMREVLARIRVVLRHAQRSESGRRRSEVLTVNDIVLEPHRHQVRVRGSPVDLPPKEFELLRLLMANAGTVLTSGYLLDAVWGPEFAGALQALYVHIGWLRERIELDPRRPQIIQTVRGVGYKFAGPRSAPAPAS
jgi:two-component system response regulator RegX3